MPLSHHSAYAPRYRDGAGIVFAGSGIKIGLTTDILASRVAFCQHC